MKISFQKLVINTSDFMKNKNISQLSKDYKHPNWRELADFIQETEQHEPCLKLNVYKMWTRNDKNFNNLVFNKLNASDNVSIISSDNESETSSKGFFNKFWYHCNFFHFVYLFIRRIKTQKI
jgi:hypothetical protein